METQLLLPKGITMNRTKTSFRIQTRKNVMINGKKDKLKDFRTVKIHYTPILHNSSTIILSRTQLK